MMTDDEICLITNCKLIVYQSFSYVFAPTITVIDSKNQNVRVFDLGSCAWTLHTSGPSLGRGGLNTAFFWYLGVYGVVNSPLERGFKGCVTVRGAAWGEMFLPSCWDMLHLLLLVELWSICRLWVTALGFRRLCTGVTHPRPLSRGEVWNTVFSL